MALEQRNGRVYYYQSRRIGDRVRREYRGCGHLATLMGRLDRVQRERKKLDKWSRDHRRARWQKRFKQLRRALGRAGRLVAAALRAAGWHLHNREWRKKRGRPMTSDVARVIEAWLPADLQARAGVLDADTAARARQGDRTALTGVREYLDNPAAVALWGDTGRQVLERWARVHANGDLVKEEAMLRRAAALRDGLAGSKPSTLDLLLAERVVLAWVTLTVVENWHAGLMEAVFLNGKLAMAEVLSLLAGQVAHAHRQLMAACRTLAKARRAKLPEVLALVSVSAAAA